MNSKYALVLAVVLGVVAAFAFQQHLSGLEREQRLKVEPWAAVFAKEDIPEGVQLREEVLESRDWPRAYVIDQLVPYAQVSSLVGKVASQRIPKGYPVLLQFVDVKQPPPPSSGIPNGKRAFTIATDAISSVSGMVKPGDRVDVIGHLKDVDAGTGPGSRRAPAATAQSSTTVTLLESVTVLGVGQQGAARRWGARGQAAADVSCVTLAVYPREAELLAHVQKQGSLTLSLRREGDTQLALPEAVDSRTLFQAIQQMRERAAGGGGR